MTNRWMTAKDPFSLILTPDYSQISSKASDDIVWEVQLDSGELGGLSIYSTLGLSASSLRIFPIFSSSSETRINLKNFSSPITAKKNSTNSATLRVEPFTGITTLVEFWIANNHLLIGRSSVKNSSRKQFSGALAWAIQYNFLVGGIPITHATRQNYPFLHGKTLEKHFVLLSTGAPTIGKIGQNALENQFTINPGEQHVFNWTFCLNENLDSAFDDANYHLNFNLDAEITRSDIRYQSEIFEFETGNRDWDLILEASQIAAKQLIIKRNENQSSTRFLKSRNPEQKLPLISGIDKQNNFDEQNLLDIWYFFHILPNSDELIYQNAVKILDDFAINATHNSALGKNSLYTQTLPFPILAELLSKSANLESNQFDKGEIFDKLILYLKSWIRKSHEEKNELTPTWANPMQSLYDYLPIHDRWHLSSEGLDTKWIKSPMLLSFLHNEFSQIIKLAIILNKTNEIDWLKNNLDKIRTTINNCWYPKRNFFSYQDSVTLSSYKGISIKTLIGTGSFSIDRKLQREQRLTLKITTSQEATRRIRIIIKGISNQKNQNEEINPREIHWYGKFGFYTSKFIYQQIDTVEVINQSANDSITISSSDYLARDLTLALPIWSGACDGKRAKRIVEKTIMSDFLQPFGLPLVPGLDQKSSSEILNNVDLPLNCMVMLGLLQYGYDQEAKQIWTNNMLAVAKNLKLFKRFLKQYDASDGYGTGDYNIVNGIPSISLFLNLLGIQKWTKNEIVINRKSVFDDPMILRFRGNIIKTTSNGHEFISPGGKKIITEGDGPHRIRIPD